MAGTEGEPEHAEQGIARGRSCISACSRDPLVDCRLLYGRARGCFQANSSKRPADPRRDRLLPRHAGALAQHSRSCLELGRCRWECHFGRDRRHAVQACIDARHRAGGPRDHGECRAGEVVARAAPLLRRAATAKRSCRASRSSKPGRPRTTKARPFNNLDADPARLARSARRAFFCLDAVITRTHSTHSSIDHRHRYRPFREQRGTSCGSCLSRSTRASFCWY